MYLHFLNISTFARGKPIQEILENHYHYCVVHIENTQENLNSQNTLKFIKNHVD